jgi:DNA-binding NarL/FixJ family response regulator
MKQSSQISSVELVGLMFAQLTADNHDVEPVAGQITVLSRHTVLVEGFRTLIAEPAGLKVFTCAGTGELRTSLNTTAPLLVLFDLACGITPPFLREMKTLVPEAGFILWVDAVTPEFVRQAIAAGVLGFLRRDAPTNLYRECLEQVSAGRLWLEHEMSQKLLGGKTVTLSPRERQLVSLLTQGLRNKEIAWRMKITEGTTKAYLSRLFEKTGAGDRFELAMFVLQNLETGPSDTLAFTRAYEAEPLPL